MCVSETTIGMRLVDVFSVAFDEDRLLDHISRPRFSSIEHLGASFSFVFIDTRQETREKNKFTPIKSKMTAVPSNDEQQFLATLQECLQADNEKRVAAEVKSLSSCRCRCSSLDFD
jgi:hypothetical protein